MSQSKDIEEGAYDEGENPSPRCCVPGCKMSAEDGKSDCRGCRKQFREYENDDGEDECFPFTPFVPNAPPPGAWTKMTTGLPPKETVVDIRWIDQFAGTPVYYGRMVRAKLFIEPDAWGSDTVRWDFGDKRSMPCRLTDEWRLP